MSTEKKLDITIALPEEYIEQGEPKLKALFTNKIVPAILKNLQEKSRGGALEFKTVTIAGSGTVSDTGGKTGGGGGLSVSVTFGPKGSK